MITLYFEYLLNEEMEVNRVKIGGRLGSEVEVSRVERSGRLGQRQWIVRGNCAILNVTHIVGGAMSLFESSTENTRSMLPNTESSFKVKAQAVSRTLAG
jgi:hypothetical protein